MSTSPTDSCRLCGAPIDAHDARRRLCSICDDYAQHVALYSNKGLERIVGELQNQPLFREPARRGH
jgi:hypothetical protein